MLRSHSQGLCSCGVGTFVAKRPNCWIDGVCYPSYGQYLRDIGHSLHYVRGEESAVAEIVELSSNCYKWSSHPVRIDSRDCAPNDGTCHCNLKIT